MTFEKILPQLIKLTADVGKVIMSFYKADMAVEMKLNKTPLTIADQRAHQLIVEGLNHLTPCKLSYLMCRYISERTISLNTQKG
jgi:3'(2'), 5'-bisphosphate nucleotidase